MDFGPKQRLFESALTDVRYYLGKPLRFDAELVRRLNSEDRATQLKAWEEAATRV